MTGEKSRRYFRYALGELLLVVAGILIALQIDGWNDDRLDRQKEREIVAPLLNDISTDRELIKQSIDGNEILLDALGDLLMKVAEPADDRQFRRELFIRSVIHTYWYMRVDFPDLTISQLSTGNNLFLIRDKPVRDSILAYKRGLDAYRHVDKELMHYFHVQEQSQKLIFNLALAKRAYEHIEQNYLEILGPLDRFDSLISEGSYLIDDHPKLLARYYGDVLFYRTTLNNGTAYLREQLKLGDELTRLIREKYAIE